METRNCRSDRRETGTQIGQIGKTENRIDIKSENPLVIFAKIENHMLKTENPQTTMNTKTEKPKFFWRKNLFKNSQNRKTENPNPPPPFILG